MRLEEEIQQKEFKDEFQKLMLNIVFTGNWLNSQSIQSFKPFGISPQQYNVLRILKGQYPDAITVNKIASRMLDKNSNASRLVDKLVSKELVEREPCVKDRRQMDVAISTKGLKLLEEMKSDVVKMHKRLKGAMNERDAKVVNDILDNLRS